MKRIITGKFYNQFYILPAIGLKRTNIQDDSEEYHIAFAWFNRGISILIFVKKYEGEVTK